MVLKCNAQLLTSQEVDNEYKAVNRCSVNATAGTSAQQSLSFIVHYIQLLHSSEQN